MPDHIILSSEMQKRIGSSLEDFLIETRAEHAVFASNTGEIIENVGREFGKRIFSITALLMGVFNTTRELASILNEKDFEQFYLKGQQWKLFYQKVTPLFVLIVLFRDKALLGSIRISSRKFAQNLLSLFTNEGTKRKENKRLDVNDRGEEDVMEGLFRG